MKTRVLKKEGKFFPQYSYRFFGERWSNFLGEWEGTIFFNDEALAIEFAKRKAKIGEEAPKVVWSSTWGW